VVRPKQFRDVLEAARRDAATEFTALKVDGGATANRFLMQFQADILGIPVEVPETAEITAVGAAYLAGLGAGWWRDLSEVASLQRVKARFEPTVGSSEREGLYRGWRRAVERARNWIATEGQGE